MNSACDAPTRHWIDVVRATLLISLMVLLPACTPSASDDDPVDDAATPSSPGAQPAAPPATSVEVPPASSSSSGSFSLKADVPSVQLTEGEAASDVRISLAPLLTNIDAIDLAIDSDSEDLQVSLSPLAVQGSGASVLLSVAQPIGIAPIVPRVVRVSVTATDDTGENASLSLSVNLRPTARPDVYLLAGQSNMVGFSGPGSQLAGAGQPDAPMTDVLQLNVTGNDAQNFAAPAAFTDSSRIAVKSPRYVTAIDPLHDGFDGTVDGKAGSQIGPALSFARRAREATTADIILVPAAWSDTGFCERATNRFEGMGWNPEPPDSDAFSGTLLFDRALARTNLALTESDGVLRGILWHQGEADSDDPECAPIQSNFMCRHSWRWI